MIRINVTETRLLAEIKTRSKTWLQSADETRKFNEAAGKFERKTPNWSTIKGVYISMQNGKCAYCERQLTIEEKEGGHEWDVEHFRPKTSVSAWPTQRIKEERHIDYDLPKSKEAKRGYHLISHHPLNYVVSCKICNSKLKGNYFPVRSAPRLTDKDDPRLMAAEEPLLIYPLGDLDDDPEEVIGFHGVSPQEVGDTNDNPTRAKVTIDFFNLTGRPTLDFQRATAITHMANILEWRDTPGVSQEFKEKAKRTLHAMLYGIHPHQNCARSFERLYEKDKIKGSTDSAKIAERARIIFERDLGPDAQG